MAAFIRSDMELWGGQTVLDTKDPAKEFIVDPNGYVTAVDKVPAEQRAVEKAKLDEELREMEVRASVDVYWS